MFTGIVEETGVVRAFERGPRAYRLVVAAHQILQGLAQGDSIAVNGCCLTAVASDAETVSFDLLEETVRLTNFSALGAGGKVNLERSLRFDGKVGGHFVTGHIDTQGEIAVFERRGTDCYLRVRCAADWARYLIHKGSIAIDGISLTVAEAYDDGLAVWLIPHTLEVTNLHAKSVGDRVNLEFDLLGKYVERLLEKRNG